MPKQHRWCYLLFLIWLSYILTTQVLHFTGGFLLTRTTRSVNSSCDYVERPTTQEGTCLPARARVVLLIVDALRHDFTVYNESSEAKPYRNKLPVIAELLRVHPERTRLMKFVADPPTTTMQRLKGLTTGSLPTFIDAGSNFATHEINEDNLIDQLVSNGKQVVFMGDDTWDGLYPKRFIRNRPFPSFNVWDLDTVDNGVRSHLYDELKLTDWSLLIGHFLGVDHVGHRHGPDHPEMSRKLTEINDVIRNVTEMMPEDTMLFVIGDHGMTSTGDHGGESENEVTAGMFVHGKIVLSGACFELNGTVKQVDLVPSLSTILGIPIPHSNLGSVIHPVLPSAHWQATQHAALSNAAQIHGYIKEYSNSSDTFDRIELELVYEEYERVKSKVLGVKTKEEFESVAIEIHEFVKRVRKMCEDVWIQFDSFAMARGLLIFSHVVIFLFLLVDGLKSDDLNQTINFTLMLVIYSVTAVTFVGIFALYQLNFINFTNNLYFVTGLGALIVLIGYTVYNFQRISESFYETSQQRHWYDLIARLILTFSALMLLTNSFILEEAKVTLFFLVTFILILVVNSKISFKNLSRNKLLIASLSIALLLRFTMYYWKCREEQNCRDYVSGKENSWVLGALALGLLTAVTRMWLRACGNLNGFSVTVLFAKFAPTAITVVSISFWVLHKLPKETKARLLGPLNPDFLAVSSYALIAATLIATFVSPLMIFYVKNKKSVDSEKLIPELAKQLFAKVEKRIPVVYGLATVYSAAFITCLTALSLLWGLLLGLIVTPSLVALILTAALILVITSISRFEQAARLEELFKLATRHTILWFVCSIYAFYATAHQPSFPAIAWEAAFVGTGGNFDFNFVPATLVILNTFGSYLIFGFAVPLLHTSPFAVALMLPNFFPKKSKFDVGRGEMLIFENEEIVAANVFKTCCKYITCHALRVFASMLAATIHCRHLMVWNIFAPKLIFEAIGFFITLGSVTAGYFLFVRVNSSVSNLVRKLEKETS